MANDDQPTDADAGAALLFWYDKAIKQYPEGLVTQAQAATMLGISRVAVSRLVTRGHLRAVYFPEGSDDPEKPDYVGAAVGQDDPVWLKLFAWVSQGSAHKTYSLPKAAYVAFADVLWLWRTGTAKDKCKREWREIDASRKSDSKSYQELAKIQAEQKRQAAKEREGRTSNANDDPEEQL